MLKFGCMIALLFAGTLSDLATPNCFASVSGKTYIKNNAPYPHTYRFQDSRSFDGELLSGVWNEIPLGQSSLWFASSSGGLGYGIDFHCTYFGTQFGDQISALQIFTATVNGIPTPYLTFDFMSATEQAP
jgi:hypothetical protein